MSRARSVIKLMNEVSLDGVAVTSLDQLKSGSQVMFKGGHELEGMPGIVINMRPADNTVDLKVGKATKIQVPIADLLVYSQGDNLGAPKAAPAEVPVV